MGDSYQLEDKKGYTGIINNENSELQYLSLDRILLGPGEKTCYQSGNREQVMVLQQGDFEASVITGTYKLEGIKGSRKDVFDEYPSALFIPPGSRVTINTVSGFDSLVYSSPTGKENIPLYIAREDIDEITRGSLSWKRKMRILFGPESGKSNIIIGESVSVPGGWIGFPPHKHDTENEKEYPLDEIYFFKTQGPRGAYAIHHTYNREKTIDEHYTIDTPTAVTINKGFHTSFAVPGCRLYMLWGLAGDKKVYKLSYDERFTWLSEAEALYRQ